jgi:hypothetical protein
MSVFLLNSTSLLLIGSNNTAFRLFNYNSTGLYYKYNIDNNQTP